MAKITEETNGVNQFVIYDIELSTPDQQLLHPVMSNEQALANAKQILEGCFMGKKLLLHKFNKEAGAPFNVTDIVLVLKSDGPTTAVEYTAATIQCQKVIENGQVLIIRDGKTFNLFGAEVR